MTYKTLFGVPVKLAEVGYDVRFMFYTGNEAIAGNICDCIYKRAEPGSIIPHKDRPYLWVKVVELGERCQHAMTTFVSTEHAEVIVVNE